MKKKAIWGVSLLALSFFLSLFIIQRITRTAPGKIQFISTSLWDPLVVHLAMMAGWLVVFAIVLWAGKILLKKLQWGKWKTGLVYTLEGLFWILIIWIAYAYSIHMIRNVMQFPAPLAVNPLMLSLKAFVFYLIRNILILGAIMHGILFAGLFWAWFKRKKRGQVSTFHK